MDLSTFLEAHQAQWPLGKMQTLHQTHQIALGSTLVHPLQESDFLRTANFIQLTICRPKCYALLLRDIREFTKKILAITPANEHFNLDVEESEMQEKAITLRILAVQLHV
ncbi:hypothetical protein [Simplicispira psychrophila]|uniref:hypothetical protein n=1 Tax=Simplicispira psychrophila TaxID=80882 RepID=UPI0012EBBE78|nr:hypothetical protein [Simplicispira psychrophila]